MHWRCVGIGILRFGERCRTLLSLSHSGVCGGSGSGSRWAGQVVFRGPFGAERSFGERAVVWAHHVQLHMKTRLCLDFGDEVPRYNLRVAFSSSDPQPARCWERALRTAVVHGAMQAGLSVSYMRVVAMRTGFELRAPGRAAQKPQLLHMAGRVVSSGPEMNCLGHFGQCASL